MCGRYTLTTPAAQIADYYELDTVPTSLAPRYNIAPSQQVPTIHQMGGRQLVMLRWGLVPSWAKDIRIGSKMINARAETVAEKPSFRAAFKRRRCLVIADGFYEWVTTGKQKQPYWIGLQDRAPMAFAGLWEHWTDPSTNEPLETCTIIVTQANRQISALHERMPVILEKEHYSLWLDPEFHSPGPLKELLIPYRKKLITYPVSRDVNSPRNNNERLIEPVTGKSEGP